MSVTFPPAEIGDERFVWYGQGILADADLDRDFPVNGGTDEDFVVRISN